MNTKKHFELCRRAHLNTSHRPDQRAEYYCQLFDDMQAELQGLDASPEIIEKSERLFVAWMSAKCKCMSSMITGPSGFPTARAEKAYRSEEKKGREYLDHFENAKNAIKKERHYDAHPEARPISASDADALPRLKEKLDGLERQRELNNAINEIVRSKPRAERTEEKAEKMRLLGLSERVVNEVFKGNSGQGVGIPAFVNQNLSGNISRIKLRIAQLEKTKQVTTERIDLGNGVFVTQDTDAMRVFFEFGGKPDEKTRSRLKSNGFRWTPSQGHWGRKLTGNASHAARQVMAEIKQEGAGV